jgi:hypothetical protein
MSVTTSSSFRAIALATALGMSSALAPNAMAGDYRSDRYAPIVAPDVVYSYAIVGGMDAVKHAYEGYLGAIVALNQDLDKDGVLFRVLGARGFYEYDSGPFNFDGDYWQGDIMVGYQFIRDGISFATFVGVDFQKHDISPFDPLNSMQGSETGFKVAVDIETERHIPSPVYFALRGAYSTAFDTYYALGRVGMNFGRFAIGPEAMLLGDDSGDAQRIGIFGLTDISLGGPTVGTLSLSVGYQFVDNAGDYWGRNFGEEGVYGTLSFSMAFGETRAEPLK